MVYSLIWMFLCTKLCCYTLKMWKEAATTCDQICLRSFVLKLSEKKSPFKYNKHKLCDQKRNIHWQIKYLNARKQKNVFKNCMRRGRRLQYLGGMSHSAALETYYKRGEFEWKEMICTTLAMCTADTIVPVQVWIHVMELVLLPYTLLLLAVQSKNIISMTKSHVAIRFPVH